MPRRREWKLYFVVDPRGQLLDYSGSFKRREAISIFRDVAGPPKPWCKYVAIGYTVQAFRVVPLTKVAE